MKHTPGPLEVVLEDADAGEKWYDIWSPIYGSVAHLSEGARSDEGRQFLKGDAFLFAAAPDLLEACERALHGLVYKVPDGYLEQTAQMLTVALIKARGES